MKAGRAQRWWFGLGVALLLAGLIASAPLALQAQGSAPQGTSAGTAFTYQGRLLKNDNPVSGSCDFQFSLWDAQSGGSQVGSEVTKSGLDVQEGYFAVDLDFGGSAFTGDARYLQVEVKCGGDSAYTNLGRVALNGAPYALGLRPGAVINGSVPGGTGLTVVNSSSTGHYAISGRTDSNNTEAVGVYGYASSTSAEVYGVLGEVGSADSSSAGVKGVSNSGAAPGVHGATTSDDDFATGVYGSTAPGSNRAFGVKGETYASGTASAGVHGSARASSGEVYGVYGQSDSSSGRGVYGLATDSDGTTYGVYGKSVSYLGNGVGGEGHTGVYGKAVGGTLINPSYGVYAAADPSGESYGLYSDGDAHVDGLLTWRPVTGYLSIPAAAFVPADNYNSKTLNSGSFIRPNGSLPENIYAPVHLPHNAVITEMTAHWRDTYSGGDGTITLYRSTFAGNLAPVAQVSTSGSGGDGSSSDSNIDAAYARVDNSGFMYYVNAYLPTDGTDYVGIYAVVIEYTIDRPH